MTNKRWILVFVAVAVLCVAALAFLYFSDHGSIVTITQDNTVLHTIDLDTVKSPYELTVPYGDHYNTIHVGPGEIYVLEADCTNQVCVDHGALRQMGAPITCLPHHLIINWKESGVDG